MTHSLMQASLTFAAFLYLLLPVHRLSRALRLLVLACLLLISKIPLDGLPLAAYLRGFVGDLAVTTMALLIGAVVWRTMQWSQPNLNKRALNFGAFAMFGLVLYPATLGLSAIDPYRLGFQPDLLLIVVACTTLALCLLRAFFAAFSLILATVAFTLDTKLSDNYWDYIVDPLLAVYALLVVLQWLKAELWARVRLLRSQRPALPVRES